MKTITTQANHPTSSVPIAHCLLGPRAPYSSNGGSCRWPPSAWPDWFAPLPLVGIRHNSPWDLAVKAMAIADLMLSFWNSVLQLPSEVWRPWPLGPLATPAGLND